MSSREGYRMDDRKKRMRRPTGGRIMFPLYWRGLKHASNCRQVNRNDNTDTEELQKPSSSGEETVDNEQANAKLSQPSGEKTTNDKKSGDGRQLEINDKIFAEAVKLHNLGVDGDKEAVIKVYKLFEKMYEEDPDNHLVAAYYGSVTTLLGRDAIDPAEKFQKALKGNKILDRAVASDPNNHEIRILRGYVSYRLPEMYFHRTATAVEDFNYLVSSYEQDNSVFSREFYWQLLFDLGAAYKTLGQKQEAESTWTKLLSSTTDPKYKELVKQEGMEITGSLSDVSDAESPSEPQEVMEKKKEVPQEESPEEKSLYEEFLREGMKFYTLALEGDKEAVQKVFKWFEKAHKEKPDDPLVLAHYADSLSMMGRDSMNPTEMFAKPIQAMKMLDKAVNSRPDDVTIRLIRANQSYRLPEPFFRRSTTAVADFEYLIARYEQDNSILSPETLQEILFKLGMSYKRLGMDEEAQATWQRLRSLDHENKYRTPVEEQEVEDEIFNLESISPDNRDQLVKEAIRLHDLGVAGNKKAVKIAHDLLQRAHEADPGDPVVMGYYGSCIALLGRDSNDPGEMFGNGIKGFVMLKKAIARDWSNPQLRVLRGYLAYNLPEAFFPMTERAVKDLRFVKSAYEQDNSLFSEEFYWQVLYDLGVAYRRLGDEVKAQKVWTKLMKVAPESKYKDLIDLE